jgi:hypothetical protein
MMAAPPHAGGARRRYVAATAAWLAGRLERARSPGRGLVYSGVASSSSIPNGSRTQPTR